MTKYDAIMKAADHIERNPHLYQFHESDVPKGGCAACMWGWIGYFLGVKAGKHISKVYSQFGFDEGQPLYETRRELDKCYPALYAADAVKTLRHFAKRYKTETPAEADKPDPAFHRFLASLREWEAA